MKRVLSIFAAVSLGIALVAGCNQKSYCPEEVNVPIVSADIPDTVNFGEMFTCDFVLDKGECIKEYGVHCTIISDTVLFLGCAMQDFCECLDNVPVEASISLKLGDYDKYLVVYSAIDSELMCVGNVYDHIFVKK